MKLKYKIALTSLRIRLKLIAFVSPKKAAAKALVLFCRPRRKPPQSPSAIIKKAKSIRLSVNGLCISGYRWNHPAPKKILIAHGFESSARNFEGFAIPLTKKGYEVVAFDAPGHGKSEGNEITLPGYVRTLQSIVREYGPFDAYIAHSLGGLAVTHLLETIPHDETTKLALIAPAKETTTAIDGFFHFLHLNGKVRTAFDRLVEIKGGFSPEYISVRRAVKNVTANILWLHDKDDAITPLSDAEKVKADDYPNITFVISNGLGHSKIYRDKHTVNHILQFL